MRFTGEGHIPHVAKLSPADTFAHDSGSVALLNSNVQPLWRALNNPPDNPPADLSGDIQRKGSPGPERLKANLHERLVARLWEFDVGIRTTRKVKNDACL